MENLPKRKYKKHKQAYTVSVTYFLRKDKNFLQKILSKDENRDGLPLLPIYIRVTFLQQSTTIRSRLLNKLTEVEFDAYIIQPDIAKLVEYETQAIRYSIDELKPDTIDGFVMNQWTYAYNQWNDPIKKVAQDIMQKMLVAEYKGLEYSPFYSSNLEPDESWLYSGASSFGSISIMARLGVTIAQKYVKKYNTVFDMDNFECDANKVSTFTMWDWRLNLYQSFIRDNNEAEIADSYLKTLGDILKYFQGFMQPTPISSPNIIKVDFKDLDRPQPI